VALVAALSAGRFRWRACLHRLRRNWGWAAGGRREPPRPGARWRAWACRCRGSVRDRAATRALAGLRVRWVRVGADSSGPAWSVGYRPSQGRARCSTTRPVWFGGRHVSSSRADVAPTDLDQDAGWTG